MVSTYTTNKSLEKPGNGDYVDTWNVPVNGDMDIIDQAFGGTTFLNATAGSAVLTANEYASLIINISGSIGANVTYTIPSGVGGQWIVYNTATGANVYFVSAAGGSAILAYPGVTAIYCDGTSTGMKYLGVTSTGGGASGTWNISISGNAATATTAGSVTGGYVQSVTAGTNITISGTSTNPVINAASAGGTVTSVDASAGSGFSFSGGPITGSGTLALSVPAPGASGNVLTSNGTSWVSQTFTGPTTLGAVGTYGFFIASTGPFLQGQTASGSVLTWSNIGPTSNGPSPSGTWQCMGASGTGSSVNDNVTLWIRIA